MKSLRMNSGKLLKMIKWYDYNKTHPCDQGWVLL